jgi:hypothetical protein
MKKLLVYTLFGEEEFYQKGLLYNIKHAQSLFPEFKIRLYVDSKLSTSVVRRMESPQTEIIVKKSSYKYNGLLWRFLPLSESNTLSLFKDADLKLTDRDRWVATDFAKSDSRFYVLRDGPGWRSPIMAGAWGAKIESELIDVEALWEKWRKRQVKSCSEYLWDQGFLGEKIYPLIRRSMISYTEHVIYDGENDIRRIPHSRLTKSGICDLLPYPEEFLSENDSKKTKNYHAIEGISMNEGRRQFNNQVRIFFGTHDVYSPTAAIFYHNINNDLNFMYYKMQFFYPRHTSKYIIPNELRYFVNYFCLCVSGNKVIRSDFLFKLLRKLRLSVYADVILRRLSLPLLGEKKSEWPFR